MGTKNNPGRYDCYDKAEPDEPIFVLLARDPLAADLVREWAIMSEGEPDKLEEAYACANAMDEWRKQRERNKLEEAYTYANAMDEWRKQRERK